MLKIEIEIKNKHADVSEKGLASAEEMFTAYQSLLIVSEEIKHTLVEQYQEASGKNEEESKKAFNKIIEDMQAVIQDD